MREISPTPHVKKSTFLNPLGERERKTLVSLATPSLTREGLVKPGGVGQASRASIIAESAQRNQSFFPLTRFAAWYRVSADFANLSKFSSCS